MPCVLGACPSSPRRRQGGRCTEALAVRTVNRRRALGRRVAPPRRDVNAPIAIALSAEQVDHVVREFSGGDAGLGALFADVEEYEGFSASLTSGMADPRLSHSVLRGLLVLAAFPSDGTPRPMAEVADRLGLKRSTTHRYLLTWVTAGMLEQVPPSRLYRRRAPWGSTSLNGNSATAHAED